VLSKSFPLRWLARPRSPAHAGSAAQGRSCLSAPVTHGWLPLLLSPTRGVFWGRNRCPPILGAGSQLQPRIASVFLAPETGAGAAPSDAVMEAVCGGDGAAGAGAKGAGTGSHLQQGRERAGARCSLSPLGRGNGAVNLCASGFFKVVSPTPPAPRVFIPGSGCHQSLPCTPGGRVRGRQADTQPRPGSLPSARAGSTFPGASSGNLVCLFAIQC